jgi:uncharacterized protein
MCKSFFPFETKGCETGATYSVSSLSKYHAMCNRNISGPHRPIGRARHAANVAQFKAARAIRGAHFKGIESTMSRVLFILAVVAVVYLLFKSRHAGHSRATPAEGADRLRPAEDMVRCVQCGVHLPRSEAILAGGKFYCCEAHRLAYRAQPTDRDAG